MDGFTIATIVLGIALFVAGGYIRRLVKEVKELITVIHIALADDAITKEELVEIIKEATDVKDMVLEIALLVSRKPN